LTESDPNGGLRTDESKAQTLAEASVNALTVDEGAFMNLTSAIQSIHLKVWVTIASSGTLRMESIVLSDERALVHAAGRLFSQGAAEEATKHIRQAQTGFDRKKAEWERRVRQSEDDSARRRAMRELQQKKGYHSPITSRITPVENQFRRLVEALDFTSRWKENESWPLNNNLYNRHRRFPRNGKHSRCLADSWRHSARQLPVSTRRP